VNLIPELTDLSGATSRAAASSPRLGDALWAKITLAHGLLNIAAQRFWSHLDLQRIFPLFQLELYSIVRCSVPLMKSACERAAELAGTDPLAASTAKYFKRHIEEEGHHDNPPLAEHLNEIQSQTGYSPDAFRCLQLHAADDIEHLNELRSTITDLPLSRSEAALISTSAFATLQGLLSIFDDLIAKKLAVR